MSSKTRAEALLDSARTTLTEQPQTFHIRPWREIMATKNQAAVDKSKEVKAAVKKVIAAGVAPYKHRSKDPGAGLDDEAAAKARAEAAGSNKPVDDQDGVDDEGGIDSTSSGGVQSGFSAFNPGLTPPNHQESTMNKTTSATGATIVGTAVTPAVNLQGTAVPQATLDKEAAVKAKIAEKEAKAAKQAAAKAAADKAKAERAEAKAKAKAETDAKKAERASELAAAGRTYTGSMVALSERVKMGLYVKSATGQLRSTDELAIAMDAVEPVNTVKLGTLVFGEANKYGHLNIGQQSMNYRNRLRGALKNGYEMTVTGPEGSDPVKVKLTIDVLKELIANHKLAVDIAAIQATKDAVAKAKADAKAAAEKAKIDAKDAALKAAAEKIAASKDTTPAPTTSEAQAGEQAAA